MSLINFKQFIEEKCSGAQPLLIVIRGSQAYGTNTPTSDTDYAGVYIQSKEDIFGVNYKEQINDDKNDTVFYELRRFLELVASNNPTILELMNTPEDCIIYKHPLYDLILQHKNEFITKVCAKSFGGYAIQQIKKAKGQNKKQNWEKEKVERKTPLDFCYLHRNEKSFPLIDFLNHNGLNQENCGLSKIPHSRDLYALFYDWNKTPQDDYNNIINRVIEMNSNLQSELALNWFDAQTIMFEYGNINPNFRGIVFEDSNDIRLSSIPKDLPHTYYLGSITYNKDEYSKHCKDYNSYQEWLEKRNEQRWVDVESHGQKIDGKNMMHCRRLLTMAREIGEGKGIIVRRPDREELLDIRKGEVDLQTLIDNSENDILEIDEIFKNSNLPESVDKELVNSILIKIRSEFYK
jgi:uncharacterized protein